MGLEKYFEMILGDDVTSKVKDLQATDYDTSKISFREVSLPGMGVKYVVPVNSQGEYFSDSFIAYNVDGRQYCEGKDGKSIIVDFPFESNEGRAIGHSFIDHNRKLENKISNISFTRGVDYKDNPEMSTVKISMKNNNGVIIPEMDVNIFRNCMDLNAKVDESGNLRKLKCDYSEFAAWGADMFGTIENLYQGILVEHYKRKNPEKFGDIGESLSFGDVELDKEASSFVLANEVGMKKGFSVDYKKTMDSFLKDNFSRWEDLMVFNK